MTKPHYFCSFTLTLSTTLICSIWNNLMIQKLLRQISVTKYHQNAINADAEKRFPKYWQLRLQTNKTLIESMNVKPLFNLLLALQRTKKCWSHGTIARFFCMSPNNEWIKFITLIAIGCGKNVQQRCSSHKPGKNDNNQNWLPQHFFKSLNKHFWSYFSKFDHQLSINS